MEHRLETTKKKVTNRNQFHTSSMNKIILKVRIKLNTIQK